MPNAEKLDLPKLPDTPPDDALLIDHALWDAEVGRLYGAFKVFQCHPNNDENGQSNKQKAKRPVRTGWQKEATNDPEEIRRLWEKHPDANIGLAIEPGFVALDADIYKPGKEEVLAAFEDEHGKLPRTLEFCSARGGFHLIYATKKVLGNGCGTLPDFGDVRGHGGYLVGPGSIVEDKRYSAENLMPPIALSKHVEGMLVARKPSKGKPRSDYGELIPWDTEQAARLVAHVDQGKLVKTYDGPFVEGERNKLTFDFFALANDRMIHPDAALDAFLGSGLDGGLEEDEIQRTWESANHDGNAGEYGAKVLAYTNLNLFGLYVDGKPTEREGLPDPVQWKAQNPNRLPNWFPGDPEPPPANDDDNAPEETSGKAEPYAVLTGAALFDGKPVRYLVKRTIPDNSLGLLFGPYGAGKSFTAIDIIARWSLGWPVLGMSSHHSRRGLYIAAEGEAGVRRRLYGFLTYHNLPIDRLPFDLLPQAPQVSDERDMARLLATVERGDYGMIIYDTVSRGMVGKKENLQEDMSVFVHQMDQLKRATGAAVIGVHHTNKAGDVRGSTVLPAGVDWMLEVSKTGDLVRVTSTKMKDDLLAQPKFLFCKTVELPGWKDEDGDLLDTLVLEYTDEIKGLGGEGDDLLQCIDDACLRVSRDARAASFGEVSVAAKRLGLTGYSASTLRKNFAVGSTLTALDGGKTWQLVVTEKPGNARSKKPTRWFTATARNDTSDDEGDPDMT